MQNDGDFVNVSCYRIIGQERTRTLDSYTTLSALWFDHYRTTDSASFSIIRIEGRI